MRHPVDDLTALVDGALTPADRAAVEAHLATCEACRAERDRIARTLALVGLVPAATPSPGFEARFYARLAAERAAPRHGLRERIAWRFVAPALAAAAAAVSVSVYVAGRHRADEAFLAEHLELFESYEAVASVGAVETPEDVQVIAHLHEAEEGRP